MTAPSGPAPAGAKPRKRTVAFLIFLGVLVVAGIAGVIYWRYASQFEETDDAFIDGNIVAVSPQIAGRIQKVLIRDNQDVKAGDVLVEIDPTDYIHAVNQSKATLEIAKAALLMAEARVEVAQTNVDLVKANTDAMLTQAKAAVATAQAAVEQAQAAAQQAQAGVERAQAGVEQSQATVQWAQAQVASAQADVDAAKAEANRRDADVKRYDAVDPRALSQQQRDAARAAADAANAQLVSAQKRQSAAEAQVAQEQSKLAASRATQAEAQAALAAAKSNITQAQSRLAQAQGGLQAAQTSPQQIATAEAQVKTAQAGVDQAQAGIDQAQAALDSAQQQLSYTKVLAPVSGRVTRKSVQPGQVVEPGRNLMALVEPNVWVTANFKETQLTRMHAGQSVEIRVDTYPGRVFQGKIDSFQSGTGARFSLMPPENATGNFVKVVQRVPVKIVFTDDAGAQLLLGPGMSVVPRVKVAGNEGAPAPIGQLDSGAN